MQTPGKHTQLVFHYLNGQTETFNIPHFAADTVQAEQQDLQRQVRQFLENNWWILHLAEQTVCIHAANVVKVEVKPAIPQIQGKAVFSQAQRVTALSHYR